MTDNPGTHIPDDEFQDPLEDYEPPEYGDRLEEALGEQPVTAMQAQPFECIPPDMSVEDAIQKLAEIGHACLLVTEGDRLVGLFMDRDVLDRVALEYDQVRDKPVSDVMTTNPVYVHDTDSAGAALCVMAVSGYRHVPVVSLDGKLVGIVSPQRVTEFLVEHMQQA